MIFIALNIFAVLTNIFRVQNKLAFYSIAVQNFIHRYDPATQQLKSKHPKQITLHCHGNVSVEQA